MNYKIVLSDKEMEGTRNGKVNIKLYRDGSENVVVLLSKETIKPELVEQAKTLANVRAKVSKFIDLDVTDKQLESVRNGMALNAIVGEDEVILLYGG
jgi:hypothetical protein